MKADRYCCFRELERNEERGRDFVITTVRRTTSTCLVLAPHGGGIERGTSDIARAIAGENFNLYLFEGIKPTGNGALHITSSRFDEPSCLDVLSSCDLVAAIHGCKGEIERVLLGGLHRPMMREVSDSLRNTEFMSNRQGTHSRLRTLRTSAIGAGRAKEFSSSFHRRSAAARTGIGWSMRCALFSWRGESGAG